MSAADDLALSFGRAAADYERGRPEWPDEPIDRALAELGLTSEAAVLDLGAGTGKLTRKLVQRFAHVVAVEPDAAMRALLEEVVPGAEALAGTARVLPLPDDAVDAVFVGEAFHWFAGSDELREIARVLSAGGALVLLWYKPLEHVLPHGFGSDPRTDRQRAASGAWREAFADAPFEPLREAQFEQVQRLDRASVLAYFASISPIASLPDNERRARLDEVASQLDRETYERRWRIDVYWTRLAA